MAAWLILSGETNPSEARIGEPGRNRTFNQQIKSLLLCQLSYGPTREWRRQRTHVARSSAHCMHRAPTGKPKVYHAIRNATRAPHQSAERRRIDRAVTVGRENRQAISRLRRTLRHAECARSSRGAADDNRRRRFTPTRRRFRRAPHGHDRSSVSHPDTPTVHATASTGLG